MQGKPTEVKDERGAALKVRIRLVCAGLFSSPVTSFTVTMLDAGPQEVRLAKTRRNPKIGIRVVSNWLCSLWLGVEMKQPDFMNFI
jgi:hypothetical protein